VNGKNKKELRLMSTEKFGIVKRYFDQDAFARSLGIEVTDIDQGRATARMELSPGHHNSFGVTHGGALFSLADLAFAVAANTHEVVSLSINAHMQYIKATRTGMLIARAYEVSSSRKLGMYRVDITDDTGDIVATFEGMVYRKKERLEECIKG
jgi:acyl-CoA thioesterase